MIAQINNPIFAALSLVLVVAAVLVLTGIIRNLSIGRDFNEDKRSEVKSAAFGMIFLFTASGIAYWLSKVL